MAEKPRALLVVYGHFQTLEGRIHASDILKSLVGHNYWLTSRLPSDSRDGMTLLFYQSGVGFSASAKLGEVGKSQWSDWRFPGPTAINLFPIKLTLGEVHIFAEAVKAKPFAAELSFIKNKTYWGHAFRFSPRLIPQRDVDLILRIEAQRAQETIPLGRPKSD